MWGPVTQSVQPLSHVRLFATPWITACQASLSITNSWSLLKLMPIESVMPSSHLVLYRPLLLLPPIPPSIRVFSNESTLRIRWPKYWSFSQLQPQSFQWTPRTISFRMDWLDLLAVQGTVKSLLQHHRSKASIFRHSGFFIVQISHPYMTTGKTIALTRWTFLCKVMSLLFNMLSKLVITFLPSTICSDFWAPQNKVWPCKEPYQVLNPDTYVCHKGNLGKLFNLVAEHLTSVHQCEIATWRRSFGGVDKRSFITLPVQGGHSRLMPSRLCPTSWEMGRGLIVSGWRIGL